MPPVVAERYLGRAVDVPEIYAHHSLLEEPLPDTVLILAADAPLRRELEFLRSVLA
jgi:hypothetical protein